MARDGLCELQHLLAHGPEWLPLGDPSASLFTNTAAPSILLANIQSLENKIDELSAWIKFQHKIKSCCVLMLTETWLSAATPNTGITPADFSIFRQDRTLDSAGTDINEYIDSITSYISKCTDDIVPKINVRTFPNQKPWINTEVQAKQRARTTAYNTGDLASYKKARYDLQRTIRLAKRNYRDRVESNYRGSNLRHIWNGLCPITDYKGGGICNMGLSSSVVDELNAHYARFEANNTSPATKLPVDQESCAPSISVSEVVRSFKAVNPRKAPGPDGIHSRRLRACFKRTTIVPVPKKLAITCLNDYSPVALTSTAMKCFERLVKTHICSSLPATMNPHQFAYRSNRSTDDAIALTVHSALTHLDRKNTYVRMLFIDYSSAFNTIIPAKLIPKLTDLGLNSSPSSQTWVCSTLTLSTGAPQGCGLSPLLYSLFTHDCVARHTSSIIFKFADDTTILGLITDGDETAYRDEVSALSEWCYHNNLSLNISKTKEMIVDYRKLQRGGHSPLYINGAEVEWSALLGSSGKFGLPPDILSNFYRCTIESILTACITVWYGSCSAYDRKALKRVVRTAESIIGSKLPDLQDIYRSCCLRKIQKIRLDCSHPAHDLFTLLPSGRRYRSIQARTN
ncbi:hypothetical protein NFI96_005401 [Prochilodus magdalenae]|nr:hypothetical protein NFI96_005401 [Prochilodus magdalenae]